MNFSKKNREFKNKKYKIMNKTIFKLFTLLFFVTISSCDSPKKMDYKFADSPKVLTCDFANSDLYNEAVHSFENDILNTYDMKFKNGAKSYSSFINFSMRNSIKIEDIASEHSLKIAQALKTESDLWSTTDGKSSLNYSHPLVDCMVNNIKTSDIKRTMNALLSTNSMRPKLILAPLSSSSRAMQADGSLKAYVAFDFFYSKLLNTKLEDLKNPNPQPEVEPAKPAVNGVDLNKTPTTTHVKATEKDAHAGHSHN